MSHRISDHRRRGGSGADGRACPGERLQSGLRRDEPAICHGRQSGQCAGYDCRERQHDRLRLGRLRLQDGSVRRDGRPVRRIPERRGDDRRHLRLVQQQHGGLFGGLGQYQHYAIVQQEGLHLFVQRQPRPAGRQLPHVRRYLGRRGPLLQLARQRPADGGRRAGDHRDRGLHVGRRDHRRRCWP